MRSPAGDKSSPGDNKRDRSKRNEKYISSALTPLGYISDILSRAFPPSRKPLSERRAAQNLPRRSGDTFSFVARFPRVDIRARAE